MRREVVPSTLRLIVDCSFDDLMVLKVKGTSDEPGLCNFPKYKLYVLRIFPWVKDSVLSQ